MDRILYKLRVDRRMYKKPGAKFRVEVNIRKANRMQRLTPHLISYNQAAFVKGRCMGENFVLAPELIRRTYKKRGTKFCRKVDTGKAFDKLDRKFILENNEGHQLSRYLDTLSKGLCIFTKTLSASQQLIR